MDRFREFKDRALHKTEVSRLIPKFLRRLFRKQGGFNRHVLELVAFLHKENEELGKRVREITAYLQAENGWFTGIERAYSENLAWQNAAYQQVQQLNTLAQSLRLQNDADHERLRIQIAREHSELVEAFESVRTAAVSNAEAANNRFQLQQERIDGMANVVETVRASLGSEAAKRQAAEKRVELEHERVDGIAAVLETMRVSLASEAATREAAEKRIELEHERIDEIAVVVEAVRTSLGSEAAAREAAEKQIQLEHERVDGVGVVLEAVRTSLASEAATREAAEKRIQLEHERVDGIAVVLEAVRTSLASEAATREAAEKRIQLEHERVDGMAVVLDAMRASLASEAATREAAEKRIQLEHERVDGMAVVLEAVRASLASEAATREAAEKRIQLEHERIDEVTNVLEALRDALRSEAREREVIAGQLATQVGTADSLRSQVEKLATSFRESASKSSSETAAVERTSAAIIRLETSLANLDERQVADASYVKRELQLQVQHLTNLLTSTPSRSKRGQPAKQVESVDKHEFDAFYLAFENQFRGTRADIKKRTAVYLPRIRNAHLGTAKMPVLDLGCGRGEWLELLQEQKLVALGVDLNQFMVAECSQRGLPVKQADVLEFLETQGNDTHGAITAFHLIEHLPFRTQQQFFTQCLRVLRPGGLCIFETPNPDNVQVGSNRFYSDPTHLHPLPKDYTKFAMATVGFKKVEVLPLHPDKHPLPLGKNAAPVEQFVNRMFFGEQDYAVIARK